MPLSAIGSVVPFVPATAVARESALAAAALLLNLVGVRWQTRRQIGLKSDRSEVPRSIPVALYGVWAVLFIGLRAGFDGAWVAMLLLLLLATSLSLPVTKAHEEEPLDARVPWHSPGWWSFHEDFHLALAASDAAWLAIALRFDG